MSGPPDPRPRVADATLADTAADAEAEAEVEAESEARLDTIDALRAAGDVDGLIRLARSYRSGTAGLARDLARCFDAYGAASDLGSAVASHALGLFYLHGGPVTPDEMEAAKRFRAAADAGHLAAKVVVANFYEVGIHYRADPAKSDVWYRNVARAAGIEAAPGSSVFDRAMAELGCVRHTLAVVELVETSPEDRARLLRTAKIHGHREGRASITPEALAEEQIAELLRPTGTPPPAAVGAGADGSKVQARPDVRASEPRAAATEGVATVKKAALEKVDLDKEGRASRLPRAPKAQVGLGLTAFFFSLVCVAVAIVAGHVAPPFLVERSEPLPVLGMRFDLVLPLALVAIGGLPNLLVYRLAAWLRAAMLAGAAGVAGEVLWGVERHFFSTRLMQVSDLAVAGFLAGLLVFGIFGGAKPGSH